MTNGTLPGEMPFRLGVTGLAYIGGQPGMVEIRNLPGGIGVAPAACITQYRIVGCVVRMATNTVNEVAVKLQIGMAIAAFQAGMVVFQNETCFGMIKNHF